ncbi:MAG: diguanylate cyclase [Sulfuritalea sp.]|nr:diguanylate cyclase [Sulfuritalea sp.]
MNMVKADLLASIRSSPDLPSPNEFARRVIRLTQDDKVSYALLEETIRVDPAFVARLIKLANSAWQGSGGRPVVSVKGALQILGLPAIRNLALGFSLLSGYRKGPCPQFDYQGFWSRSLALALAFQAISSRARAAPSDEAFSVGLLVNIGALALATVFPEPYGHILAQATLANKGKLAELEIARFGCHQWELGAELLTGWGLPKIYVDPVCFHQHPEADLSPVGSRPYVLTRGLALAATIADLLLDPASRTPEKVLELYRHGARVSLESAELVALGKQVATDWHEWANSFGLRTSTAFDFSWVEQVAADATLLSQSAPEDPASLRVLLVDDERSSRMYLKQVLQEAGYKVMEAENGRQALAAALENPPDIVVTDWVMPVMDGIDMIKQLRKTPTGAAQYILVITAQTDEDHLVQAFDAGTNDFIPKPVTPRVLLARLKAGARSIHLQRETEKNYRELQDIAAELSESNRRLQEMSVTDVLTGCPNRRYALERLQQEWSGSTRRQHPLSCLVVDIDWFKEINDLYGHDRGDQVLRQVSETLRAGVRTQDVVCRVGGDEFWVICPDADRAAAAACGQRLCDAINKLAIDAGDKRCGISVGVAQRSESMADPQSLINAADHNLYQAKREGRGRVK